jgi:hypothetical protein
MTADRDDRGRFAAGNPGGPGRPRRAVEQDYLTAVMSAVPPERLGTIAKRAAQAAEKGDAKARRWLTDILVGRRANTAVALTVAEEPRSLNYDCLTDVELESYDDLYGRILSGDPVSADDALAYVGMLAKVLRSDDRPDHEGHD